MCVEFGRGKLASAGCVVDRENVFNRVQDGLDIEAQARANLSSGVRDSRGNPRSYDFSAEARLDGAHQTYFVGYDQSSRQHSVIVGPPGSDLQTALREGRPVAVPPGADPYDAATRVEVSRMRGAGLSEAVLVGGRHDLSTREALDTELQRRGHYERPIVSSVDRPLGARSMITGDDGIARPQMNLNDSGGLRNAFQRAGTIGGIVGGVYYAMRGDLAAAAEVALPGGGAAVAAARGESAAEVVASVIDEVEPTGVVRAAMRGVGLDVAPGLVQAGEGAMARVTIDAEQAEFGRIYENLPSRVSAGMPPEVASLVELRQAAENAGSPAARNRAQDLFTEQYYNLRDQGQLHVVQAFITDNPQPSATVQQTAATMPEAREVVQRQLPSQGL